MKQHRYLFITLAGHGGQLLSPYSFVVTRALVATHLGVPQLDVIMTEESA